MRKRKTGIDKIKQVSVFDMAMEDAGNGEAVKQLLNDGYEPFAAYAKPVKQGELQPMAFLLRDIIWFKRKRRVAAVITPITQPESADNGSETKKTV